MTAPVIWQSTPSDPFEVDWGHPQSRGLGYLWREVAVDINGDYGWRDVITGQVTTYDIPKASLKYEPAPFARGDVIHYPDDGTAQSQQIVDLGTFSGAFMLSMWLNRHRDWRFAAGLQTLSWSRLLVDIGENPVISVWNRDQDPVPLPNDTWHHIVSGTDYDNTVRLWVNGRDVTTDANTAQSNRQFLNLFNASGATYFPLNSEFADIRFYPNSYDPAVIRSMYEQPAAIEYAPRWVFPAVGAIVGPVQFSGTAAKQVDASADLTVVPAGSQALAGASDKQLDASADLTVVPVVTQSLSGTTDKQLDANADLTVVPPGTQVLTGTSNKQLEAVADLLVRRALAGTADRRLDASGDLTVAVPGVKALSGTADKRLNASAALFLDHPLSGTTGKRLDASGDLTGVSTPSSGGVDYRAPAWRPDYKAQASRPDYRSR